MPELVTGLKEVLQQNSLPTLLVGLCIGTTMLYRGDTAARRGRTALVGLGLSFWLASTPVGSRLLERPIAHPPSTFSARQTGDVEAVIVLSGSVVRVGGGNAQIASVGEDTALRLLETVRVFRSLSAPLVIVSGGGRSRHATADIMRDTLLRLGVPANRMLLEPESVTTREQAANVGAMLRQRGIERTVLVTSSSHMARALASFHAEGLRPVPSAASTHPWREEWWLGLWPNYRYLTASQAVVYEYLGLAYYRLLGLI